MQDVTDLAFLNVLSKRSNADFYVTEYFRVHRDSNLDKWILRSITENPTNRPIFAQMIGQDIEHLVRSTKELCKHPIAGVDLNLGCPAPVVYRKNAGGGLLRKLDHVDQILATLRKITAEEGTRFTVKTRVGFETHAEFEAIMEIFAKHSLDALTIHGRTVKEKYQTPIHTDCIAHAVTHLPYPVIANGNIVDAESGLSIFQKTNAAGLMIGRGAIRNPWIFEQIRSALKNSTTGPTPTCRDVLEYIHELHDELQHHCTRKDFDPNKHVQRLKKFTNFITQGFTEDFETELRRAKTKDNFFTICEKHLNHSNPAPILPPENSRLFCGFSELLTNHS